MLDLHGLTCQSIKYYYGHSDTLLTLHSGEAPPPESLCTRYLDPWSRQISVITVGSKPVNVLWRRQRQVFRSILHGFRFFCFPVSVAFHNGSRLCAGWPGVSSHCVGVKQSEWRSLYFEVFLCRDDGGSVACQEENAADK